MPHPTLILIAAMAKNRVIGHHNRLPWHLPADLRHFKALTLGKSLLMGRKTWESLPGPLPGRQLILLTRDPHYRANGCRIAHTLEQALTLAGSDHELWVAGGESLYRQTLPLAQRLYLTEIACQPEGDTHFPAWPAAEWELLDNEPHPADERNPYSYRFSLYGRRETLGARCETLGARR